MPAPNQPLFRSNAIKHYMQREEKHAFPRFISLPLTILLWILLALFVTATALVWSEQVPMYATTQGIVVVRSATQPLLAIVKPRLPTQESIPATQESIPATQEAVPVTQEAVPATQEAVPPTQKAVPATEKPVPVRGKPLPVMQKAVPATEKPVPVKEKPLPVIQKAVPATEKPVPVRGKPLPAIQKAAPAIQKAVPAMEKPVPPTQKAVPATEKSVSVTEKPVPATQEEAVPTIEKPVLPTAMAVFFFPPAQVQNLHTGLSIRLHVGPSGQQFNSQITDIEPGVMSPEALRALFHLENASLPITQPSIAVIVKLDPAFATAYVGSTVTADVQVGSQRLISFLPGVGNLFGK